MNINQLQNDEIINFFYKLDPQRLIMSKMVCKKWNKILDQNIGDVWSKAMEHYHAYLPYHPTQLEDLQLKGKVLQTKYVQRFKNCQNMSIKKCKCEMHHLTRKINSDSVNSKYSPLSIIIFNNLCCVTIKRLNYWKKNKNYNPKLCLYDTDKQHFEKAKGLPLSASPLFSNLKENYESFLKFGDQISIKLLPFKYGLRKYDCNGLELRKIQIVQDNSESIWSLRPLQCLFWTLKTHPVMWAGDDESRVIFRTPKGALKIWDSEKRMITHKLNPSRDTDVALKSVILAKDVVYIAYDNLFIAHDLKADKELYRISIPGILKTHLSPNRVIIVAGNIYFYGLKNGEPFGSIEVKKNHNTLISKKSILIQSGRNYAFYDIDDSSLKSKITIKGTLLKSFVTKNRLIVCARNAHVGDFLQIWNINNGQVLLTAQPPQDLSKAKFLFSQNTLCLSTMTEGFYDPELTFWDVSMGRSLRVEWVELLKNEKIFYISFRYGVVSVATLAKGEYRSAYLVRKLSFS